MELLDPVLFDHSVFLGVFFQPTKAKLIEVSLDIVAKIGKEEDFSLTVPQKGMLQHFLK